MKKIEHFIIVTSLTACFFTLGLFLTSFFHETRELLPKKDPLSRPVVMLLPHQDDEMFMAGTLHRYVKMGRPVYAVIVTDGAGSVVRKILNGRGKPQRGGYEPFLTIGSRRGEVYHKNPDHLAIEAALREFKGISEKIFFSDIPDRAVTVFLETGEQTTKQNALRAYYIWNPDQGQFAIGAHSVPHLLKVWQKNKIEYILQS